MLINKAFSAVKMYRLGHYFFLLTKHVQCNVGFVVNGAFSVSCPPNVKDKEKSQHNSFLLAHTQYSNTLLGLF